LPPFPVPLRYLWNAFIRLSNRRPVGFAASLIPWSEIDAFQRVTRFRLAPWEIQIIERLDAMFVSEQSG
jgi:hypothetical protein